MKQPRLLVRLLISRASSTASRSGRRRCVSRATPTPSKPMGSTARFALCLTSPHLRRSGVCSFLFKKATIASPCRRAMRYPGYHLDCFGSDGRRHAQLRLVKANPGNSGWGVFTFHLVKDHRIYSQSRQRDFPGTLWMRLGACLGVTESMTTSVSRLVRGNPRRNAAD